MIDTIGHQLHQARQERGLTLEQVAQGTHIRLHYLQAMEAGEFERLPSPAQARGFLRSYASYLGLPPEQLLVYLDVAAAPELTEAAPSSVPAPVQKEPEGGQERSFFIEIGQRLQQQRELLGLSIEDVARHTHLRDHYLRALEAGDQDALPSPVQGRGMLHNYAAFLGQDPEPLLLLFAEGLQTRLAAKQAARPQPKTTRRPRRMPAALRRVISSDFLLGGIMVLSLAGFIIWGVIRITSMQSQQEPEATVPSIAEALLPESEPEISPTPTEPATPTEFILGGEGTQTNEVGGDPEGLSEQGEEEGEEMEVELPPPSGAGAQVHIIVRQRAWVRVTVDDKVEYEGRMLPGSAYTFTGVEYVEVITGNGAALQVFFNQQDLGQLGIYGEVVERVFTAAGVLAPTPTVAPTETPAPPDTPVPDATAAITPTPAP